MNYEISAEQGATTIFNQQIGLERGTKTGLVYDYPGNVELETATAGAGSLLLGENETGFTSILTEDSDDYYSFFIIQESFKISTIDPGSDNEYLDTQASTILDFTEKNPFGEPTESI